MGYSKIVMAGSDQSQSKPAISGLPCMLVASYYLKEPPINNQIFTKEMIPLNLEQSRDFNDEISIPNFSISIFNKATV